MPKINPLILIMLNLFFPIIIFLGAGIEFELCCFAIALTILLISGKLKACFSFSLFYLLLYWLLNIINQSNLDYLIIFFGATVYIIMRMIPVIMIAWILSKNYTSNELLSTLEKLHLPKKIILSITIVIRFLPTYRQEIKIIRESLKMRNIKLSLLRPIEYLEYLLVPVLLRASVIAEEMTANAITKGIETPIKRSSFYTIKMSLFDYCILTFIVMSFLIIHYRYYLV